jgi:hypothetical protein
MSQRKSQNLCSKFSTIKNGKINFAFDPAEKPDTIKPLNQPTKRRKYVGFAKYVEIMENIKKCDIMYL